MKIADKLKVYQKIIQLVQSANIYKRKQMIDEINEHLQLDIYLSDRTFQRYLQQLRDEFHIDISYNPRLGNGIGGYEMAIEHDDQKGNEINFFNDLSTAINTYTNLKDLKAQQAYIQISSDSSSAVTTEEFHLVLEALKNKKRISFSYSKPLYPECTEYTIDPLLIKEYNYKWYLIGTHKNIIKSFGIKRIKDVKALNSEANQSHLEVAKENLKSCLGVSYLNNPIEHIRFAATINQSKFLDEKPIHSSQKKIKLGSEVALYSLDVIINDELKMEIMSYGATLRVLEPLAFKNWYSETVATMQQNSSKENIDLDNARKMFE